MTYDLTNGSNHQCCIYDRSRRCNTQPAFPAQTHYKNEVCEMTKNGKQSFIVLCSTRSQNKKHIHIIIRILPSIVSLKNVLYSMYRFNLNNFCETNHVLYFYFMIGINFYDFFINKLLVFFLIL